MEGSANGLPWFKTKLANGGELGVANTHEEALAAILSHHVSSYKDLPLYVYQIQAKFRNELRAKSGILRGREFLMKDLYSFTRTEDELAAFYEKAAGAYMKIFTRAGVGDRTYRTFASGGAFSKFSDEFQTLTEAGEDTIYIDDEKRIAVNKEVYTGEVLAELGLKKSALREAKAIEVGNIFKLGTKYSEAEGLLYSDENGEKRPVVMGSYGIGLGRLMGTVVEVSHDDRGIIWPESIAPFRVHILEFSPSDRDAEEKPEKKGEALYRDLQSRGVEVLYDEREARPGEKLAEADLVGIPWRVVISAKTGDKIEVKRRDSEEANLISPKEFFSLLN